ncbi:hypothetical protein DKX38_027527 [Salix brachista]|uniref:Retrovirus-related Pol polyprotein from transposon TNT 1-94-like beta-barrel domain-containing protein n=1 Tax=Salix brachista TaxID=2182728 RepID=A0A5N5JC74_9ROSI|nr:hypothetical protein DKX38_027527 [Salix brachista]
MTDNRATITEIVPAMSKITDHKLNGTNYLEWSKTIRVYLRSVEKDDHLCEEPPDDETKKKPWMRDDARLFLQIRNSIDSEIVGLLNHCEFVKELMDYLEFLYSGKGNMSRMYDVCKAFYRAEKEAKSLTTYFMDFKKTYEELNVLLPFSTDIKVQQNQREKMAVMSFLAGLPSELEAVKSQILSSPEIGSLQEVFSRILRTEGTLSIQHTNNVLLAKGRKNDTGRKLNIRGGSRTLDSYTNDSNNIVCYYCHEPGHTKKFCKKLQNRNQRNQFANVITTSSTSSRSSDKTIMVSADDFAKFSLYQDSLKISTPDTAPTETGKTCLISSSNEWVIDSGATDHMTGNPETFSNFESHLAPSFVTIADGSTSKIVGFGTRILFFQSSTPNSDNEGEDENWLIYQVTIPNTLTDSSGTPHDGVDVPPTLARPPIVQVYSRRQETTDTCPTPTPLLSDPPCDLDLPIGLRKVPLLPL